MTRPLYAYAHADVAFDDAIALLADDPEGLLQEATEQSTERAHEVIANLHVRLGRLDLGKDVVVHLGHFDPVEQLRSVLPLTWEAASGTHLFPTMDATLEIAALSLHPPVVQVTIVGEYDPPLGFVGEVLDRTPVHRVAEAVVLRFVQEVAARLERRLAEIEPEDAYRLSLA